MRAGVKLRFVARSKNKNSCPGSLGRRTKTLTRKNFGPPNKNQRRLSRSARRTRRKTFKPWFKTNDCLSLRTWRALRENDISPHEQVQHHGEPKEHAQGGLVLGIF